MGNQKQNQNKSNAYVSEIGAIEKRETAQYIADFLLELRAMAKATGLKYLTYLIELAIYEAFEIGNTSKPKSRDLSRR